MSTEDKSHSIKYLIDYSKLQYINLLYKILKIKYKKNMLRDLSTNDEIHQVS